MYPKTSSKPEKRPQEIVLNLFLQNFGLKIQATFIRFDLLMRNK